MAEILDFKRVGVEWVVEIADRHTADFSVRESIEGKLFVLISCPSWDQVDSLRRQAEEAIRNRAYPRDKMSLM